MANEDPSDERTGPTGYDTLRRLERRLDEASAAAERLIAEAAASAARSAAGAGSASAAGSGAGPGDDAADPGPPPAGWQIPGSGHGASQDIDVLAQFLRSVRELIPPELQRRLAEAFRELLLALRALIDYYLERVERRRSEPAEVQDIPIT